MSATYSDTMRIQTDFEDQPPEELSVNAIVEINTLLLNGEKGSSYGAVDFIDEEDLQVTDSDFFISFFEVFKRVSSIAIPMGLSFTFSFEVFLAVLLLQLLSESEDDIAAASLVSTMMSVTCTLAFSPLFAASIDLTKKLGKWWEEEEQEEIAERSIQIVNPSLTREREKEKIEIVNINTLLISAALTIPPVVTLYYSDFILTSVFHQNSAVARSAQQFLRLYAFAVPGLMARMSSEQIIFSFGETKAAMWMALGSFSIGASLSVLLGFGINIGPFKIPKMNQKGVALGFVVESYLTALSYSLFVKCNKECKRFDFYKVSIERIRRNLDNLLDIARMGIIIDCTVAIELALTLSVVTFSGLLGTEQEAAMSYCMQFIYFEFVMLAAFSFSCAQEISRELGAKKFREAQNIARYGILTSLIYTAPLPVFFAAYPKALEVISGGASEEISKILKTLVPIMSAGVVLDAMRFNMLQQSRALNDFFVTSIIAFLGMSSGIALAAILGFETPMDINGVGMGYTFGIGITTGALFLRWKTKVAELVVVDAENNTSLESEPSVKHSLWNSFSSFFYFGRNDLVVQAKADTIEAHSLFEPP
jgi:MATE family multidrug resistance protein